MLKKLEVHASCINCDVCRTLCPEESIDIINNTYWIEEWSCTLCFICVEVCPVDCIKLTNK